MVHYQAFTPALGLPDGHYQAEQTTLKIHEKMFALSGDDFTITTHAGVPVCKCKGKALSISDKKVFTDMKDKEIFHLQTKHLTLHKSFKATDPHGKEVFEVKGHFQVMASHSTCHFTNAATKAPVELEIRGNWYDRSANITYGGQPVAHISRSIFNVNEIFADKQTYFVTVAPNVDLILIAALCTCLDEKESEHT